MLWGGHNGSLELRAGGGTTRLRATFPCGQEAEIAPGRFEVIAPRAFAARIAAGEEIHLLAGHSYDRRLASRSTGTLTLTDGDDALQLEATLEAGTSWGADFLAAHRAGLVKGLSPGFRVPRGGERIGRRGGAADDHGGGAVRGHGRHPARLFTSAVRGAVLADAARPSAGARPLLCAEPWRA